MRAVPFLANIFGRMDTEFAPSKKAEAEACVAQIALHLRKCAFMPGDLVYRHA